MDNMSLLIAQIAEDEKLAREASGGTVVGELGNWRPSPAGDEWEAACTGDFDEELLVALRPGLPRPPQPMDGYWGAIVSTNPDERGRDDASPMPAFVHAARHDPARVLADVAAKRAIMALFFQGEPDDAEPGFRSGWDAALRAVLEQLVKPYGGHSEGGVS